MSDIQDLIRDDLKKFAGYNFTNENKANVCLHVNESPWDYYQQALDTPLNRYPTFQPDNLIKTLAEYYDVANNEILLSRGSSEAIDLLIRLFCTPQKDNILICPPTFSLYEFYAKLQGITPIEVPLICADDFSWNIEAIIQALQPKIKIVFLCSPNNPTGSSMTVDNIIRLCEKADNQTIIVVDEAYIEYSTQNSVNYLLKQYKSLVILRTLSKAYGLAGIRCGVTLANAEVITWLKKIIAPYPLPTMTIDAVNRAMKSSRLMEVKEQITFIKNEKERVIKLLKQSKMLKRLWPSDTNFILFQVDNAKQLLANCAEKSIKIRYFEKLAELNDCFRVSIGKPEENDLFIATMQK